MASLVLKDSMNTKLLIAEKGKSLRRFSSEVSVSHAYLSQILNGKKTPSPTVAYKIANGLVFQ
ncbi:MAG: helix-turn-helix domain-containing protein [Bacillota bacterium]